MATSVRAAQPLEADTAETETPAAETTTTTENADLTAWLETAARRKYRIADNAVWGNDGTELFIYPVIVGFSLLPSHLRDLVFSAVTQFVTYRVAQNAEGESVQAAVARALNGAVPSAKSNDAFEAAYMAAVDRAVTTKLGELPKGASDGAKKERRKIIDDTAEAMRGAQFGAVIDRCKARGMAERSAKERKRAKKAPSTAAALDLGDVEL